MLRQFKRDLLLGGTKYVRDARVLGPAPLAVVRVNDRFRYRVTLCAPPGAGLRRLVADTVTEVSGDKRFRDMSVFADNDPSD